MTSDTRSPAVVRRAPGSDLLKNNPEQGYQGAEPSDGDWQSDWLALASRVAIVDEGGPHPQPVDADLDAPLEDALLASIAVHRALTERWQSILLLPELTRPELRFAHNPDLWRAVLVRARIEPRQAVAIWRARRRPWLVPAWAIEAGMRDLMVADGVRAVRLAAEELAVGGPDPRRLAALDAARAQLSGVAA